VPSILDQEFLGAAKGCRTGSGSGIIIWLQYAVHDYSFPAFVKFTIVFAGTLGGRWPLVMALRKIAMWRG
jgi:hypothetical protein